MDSKVLFKRTARLAVTAGLAASMTLGSFPVAVFADTAEPAPKPAVEQESPEAAPAPAEEQESPKAEEKAAEGEETPEAAPVAEGASTPVAQTAADEPAAKTWQQQINDAKPGETIALSGEVRENLTVKKGLTITAEPKTVMEGTITVQSAGVTIDGVTFQNDGMKSSITVTGVQAANNNKVKIQNCQFTCQSVVLPSYGDGNPGWPSWQPNCVFLISSSGIDVINNKFELGAVNEEVNNNGIEGDTNVAINLSGSAGKPIDNVTISNNEMTVSKNADGVTELGGVVFVNAIGNAQQDGKYGITNIHLNSNTFDGSGNADSRFAGFSNVENIHADGNTIKNAGYGFYGTSYKQQSGPSNYTEVKNTTYENVNLNSLKASLNGKEYAGIDEAINAAKDGETVQILQDLTVKTDPKGDKVDLTQHIVVPENKTVIIDLNGKTVSGGTDSADGTENNQATILNKGTLTLIDSVGSGMVKRDDEGIGGYYVIDNQGDMTIKSGSVYNNSGAKIGSSLVRNSSKDKKATLQIEGGNLQQDNFIAIKNDDSGKLIINGGTITSKEQAVQNWYDATINGGEFNGNVMGWAYAGQPSSTVINGGTIKGDVASINWKNSKDLPTVEVKGGTISGEIWKGTHTGKDGDKAVHSSPSDKTSNIVISGGEFSEKPAQEFLDPNAGFVTDANGNIIAKEPELQLKNAKVTYDIAKGELKAADAVELVGAAVDARPDEYKVTAVADSLEALNAAIKAGKTGDYELQFMAAKKGAKAKAADAQLLKTATVTLVDSTPTPEPEPEPKPEPTEKFTVTFVDNFNKTSNTVSVEKGDKVTEPADPAFEGWKFEGWFTDAAAKSAYDFAAPVNGDLTLYAGYSKAGVPTETEPAETQKPTDKKPSDKKALPQTGDNSALPVAVAAGAGVAAIAAGAVAMKRRKQE